ncbi:MAG TPA: MDR family MFS transporter [Candidatus Limnocylindria bacterium]|nr:MDR family MFS transporter [Candidatus Limnocylindria bacterium]
MPVATPAAVPEWDRAPLELPQRTRIEIFIVVLLGIFLAALDQTIVGTALPVIVTDLKGNDVYTWAFTSYLLTATVSGPLYGKLSDLFGRRLIFMTGTSIFLFGSLLCAISGEMWQFILFRGIQGLGAGALFPVSLAIIGDIFAPSERGKYQGFFGAMFGISSLIGPAIGGILTDNVGWHWIFLVNLPLGLIVLVVIWRTLPTRIERGVERRIDYLGAAVFIAALVPILIGLTNKQFGDWSDPQVGGLIALGLGLAAVFIWVESRADEPILPLHLFRIRAFTTSVFAMFFAAMGFFAAVVGMPRWYQVVQGSSATESGYQILPLLGGLIVSAIVSGQIVARTGRYKALIFVALLFLALGLYLLTNLRTETDAPLVWLWMAITGIGIGPAFAVFTLAVQNNVPPVELGTATSGLTLFQQVGGTVGLAVTGTIFGSVLLEEVPTQMVAAGVPEPVVGGFLSHGSSTLNNLAGVGDLGQRILAGLSPEDRVQIEPFISGIVAGIHQAFSIATAAMFAIGIGAALVAALLVLVGLPGGRMGEAAEAAVPMAPAGELGGEVGA